jgi:hypothetical protein
VTFLKSSTIVRSSIIIFDALGKIERKMFIEKKIVCFLPVANDDIVFTVENSNLLYYANVYELNVPNEKQGIFVSQIATQHKGKILTLSMIGSLILI